MKANYLFVTILLITLSVFGQERETSFGVRGGLNYSNYTPDLYSGPNRIADYKYRPGYFVGAYVNIPLKDKFSLQTELILSVHGAGIRDEDVTIIDPIGNTVGVIREFKFNINESTIFVPVNLQYHVGNKFYFEGGIQIGYIFKTIQKIDPQTRSDIRDFLGQDLGDTELEDFDTIDLGANLGIGYELTSRVTANLRYFLGLNKRNDTIKSSIFSLALQCQLF